MLIINAEIREKKGKSFSRKLRIQNKFPAILYGLNKTSIPLTLDHNAVFNLQRKTDFYKNTLLLLIQGKEYKVKVKAVQRHAFKLKLLHIDFLYA
ncbi:50S ribosomal protein L25 [Buchnera aphidicola (Aphis craccivora)]|uniref:50S ribosomal protein L25 n=2 Tax=cellular organisms TaxID=131567 RepID=A0A6G0Y116_APHCR|nr:50S ribosomal protein L25 [Buchnera aphidicola]KAF0747141.1 50S ribosomal protein L25 [Aphis craccivora]QCI16400.1 50S ribosomal protein L25 [Buchnera aphidicola (Aphis craccivora)]QLL40541.1 50S ribosomal protein L25 [Buchnera aphidicola (Aphis craccivore)]WAI17911.1 MAG: 50S ribosomal protein L25 [Buchnera aphidicola (Aphis craccivora)]